MEKTRIKFKDIVFNAVPKDDALNSRDKMMRQLYFERIGKEDPLLVKPFEGDYRERIPLL